MNVSQAIRSKRAVRSFSDRPLDESTIQAILNAGRRAQSSKNRQAWRFLAIQDRDRLVELAQCGAFAGHLKGAALGILILTPPPEERLTIAFDAGQAAAYMQLAAWELNVVSCPAALTDAQRVRRLLGIPAGWHPNIAISFGYPKEKGFSFDLASLLLRGRKDYDEVVHYERW